jgi:hypothetical protein
MDINHLTEMKEANISFSNILESSSKVFVTAFAVTRHYGGPEEGGWYYDVHSPLKSRAIEEDSSPEQIKFICNRLYNEFSALEEGNIGSVLGGVAIAAYETDIPLPPPPPRPYYC